MNDFRRLFPFVRPYVSLLAASLVLLVFAGLFEVLTTALAIPLFDEVLIPGAGGATAPAVASGKLELLSRYLSLLPDLKSRSCRSPWSV